MKIAVVDNYDSFTFNLVHLVSGITGGVVDVYLNDSDCADALAGYDRIILSPGPGLPAESGMLMPVIRRFAAEKPLLGVCLGHQAIAAVFGGRLRNLQQVLHGVSSACNIEQEDLLFHGLPPQISIGHYHSWVVDESCFPEELQITARDEQGNIMALRHRQLDIRGVQFHPESVLTPLGHRILANWLGT